MAKSRNTFKETRNRTETRSDRIERNFTPAPQLLPKNATQREYIQAIMDYPIVIATGYPGTGKTYIPARIASNMFNRNAISSIILSRPSVSNSNSLGFFKGDKNEKMQQWLAPVLGALREEFSPSQLEYMVREDVSHIVYAPMETIKGLSWKNNFVIIDEAEDLTIKELRAILTRIGKGTTVVLCGDISQTDLQHSGLQMLIDLIGIEPEMKSVIRHIHFGHKDEIVRSEACKTIVLAFERSGHLFKLAA